MTEKASDPFRYLPDFGEFTQGSDYVLGENPTNDEDSMAQYGRGLLSVGLRNELIVNYSERNVFRFLEDTMVDEIRDLGREARVLTTGSGEGKMEYKVAQRTWQHHPHIWATDLYPHFHRYQAMAEDRALSFLNYMQMDARQLQFEDGSFDLTEADFIVYHILGELGGPEKVIEELHRVTAHHGKTRIATRGPRHMRQLWEHWLPDVTAYLSERSIIDYAPPTSWYPNCDLERTGWLLDRIYGNKRVAFRQASPEQLILPGSPTESAPGSYINIPATEEGWRDVQWVIHVLHHNIRPVPPQGPALTEAIEAVVKKDFFETAARNGGYYPLEIEQAVFEAIKV